MNMVPSRECLGVMGLGSVTPMVLKIKVTWMHSRSMIDLSDNLMVRRRHLGEVLAIRF